MPSKIKAVFFDHDDTLVESRRHKWNQHIHVARKHYGIDLSDEQLLRENYGKPFPELVKVLYNTEDVEAAFTNIALYRNEFPKVIYPETKKILIALHKVGILTGVVTATTRDGLNYDHNMFGITSDLVDYTQTAEESDYHKPDPRVFDPAIAWLKEKNIKPSEVVYVGDALHDLNAAIGAGFNFIGVETGVVTGEVFLQNGVKSVPSIAHIIDALNY